MTFVLGSIPLIRVVLVSLVSTLGLPVLLNAMQGIRPWAANPSYWEYRGEPVFLAGGSDDDNLFQWHGEMLLEQLDRLAACGGNYVRNTMSDRVDRGFEVYPFKRLPDGKFDLDGWNEVYWERFATFLEETEKRGIIVQIEVWDRFDYSRGNWPMHPYNPSNNINYTHESSGLAAEYPKHPGSNEQPFFYTVPALENNEVVYRYQERFVDKMLSYSLQHGNVLYCMDNETKGAEEWGRWWAETIKARAVRAGKTVYVTEMWDAWDLRKEEHRRTFDYPELYDFVDVSQNNHQKGQIHWDNFQWVRGYVADAPRPINTVKTYGTDGNKFGHSDQDGLERIWRHVLGGAAAVRFHRPDSGLGLSEKAQTSLKSIRMLEDRVRIWDLEPAMDRLTDRAENEAYCATAKNGTLVVFFTDGGEVTLELVPDAATFDLTWLKIATAETTDSIPVAGRGEIHLAPPGGGLWLAILIRR